MLNIKVKEKNDFYEIKLKGRNTDLMQSLAMLDSLLGHIKREFGFTTKGTMKLLYEFKKMTKGED